MPCPLLTDEDLLPRLKLKRRGDLARWLDRWGVMWRPGPGGSIVTTEKALEAAFAREREARESSIEFED